MTEQSEVKNNEVEKQEAEEIKEIAVEAEVENDNENDENEEDEDDDDFVFEDEFECPACNFISTSCKFDTTTGIVVIPQNNISHIEEKENEPTTLRTKDGHFFTLKSNVITNFYNNGCVEFEDNEEDNEDEN